MSTVLTLKQRWERWLHVTFPHYAHLRRMLIQVMAQKDEARDSRSVLEERIIELTHEKKLLKIDRRANDRELSDLIHTVRLQRLLIEKLNQLSTRDPKTGLLNDRGLFNAVEREIATIYRDINPHSKLAAGIEPEPFPGMWVLAIDIDHLKKVNDEFGHAIGDQWLRRVTEHFRFVQKRLDDISARIGGDEFVVVLPRTDRNEATRIAGDIRILVANDKTLRREGRGKEVVCMTVSIGVAQIHFNPQNPTLHSRQALQTAIEMADEALYVAKNSGRNHVVIYEGPKKGLP